MLIQGYPASELTLSAALQNHTCPCCREAMAEGTTQSGAQGMDVLTLQHLMNELLGIVISLQIIPRWFSSESPSH